MHDFKSDLAQEEILAQYLDTIYTNKYLQFKRIHNLDQQHKGIDVVIKVHSKTYAIDEKAQLHYLNKNLPTFTFELSYLKNNILKDGWLFDASKVTEYYFLVTGIILKDEKETLTAFTDIESIKITSVNRAKLIDYLAAIHLSKEKLEAYDTDLRTKKSFGKQTIKELNPKTQGLLYFTEHLAEQPINLQLRLSYLVQIGVAKKLYYV